MTGVYGARGDSWEKEAPKKREEQDRIMKHTFEIKDGDLSVEVVNAKEDLQKIYQKALVACASEVTIRGFRRGKAPLEVAQKAIEPKVLNERFLKKVIDLSFKSCIKDDAILDVLRERTFPGTIPSVDLPEPSDGSKVIFTYPLKPWVVKLASYKGIDTKVEKRKVDDKEVDAELSRLALDEAELVPTSEEAKLGDVATLEVKGTINGIERPELQEKAIDLELGTNRFVPGFEEAVKGHREGETLTIPVRLPSNYPDGLSDKDALFTAKILSLKTKKVPTVDDGFATLQGEYPDAKDLADLKKKIAEKLTGDAERDYRNRKYSAVIGKVIQESQFALDEARLKESVISYQKEEDSASLSEQGLDLSTYLKLIQMNEATYEANVWANSLAQLKAQAVARAIREAEKLPAPSTELLDKVARERYGSKDFERYEQAVALSYRTVNKGISDAEVKKLVKDRVGPLVRQAELDQVVDFVVANNK